MQLPEWSLGQPIFPGVYIGWPGRTPPERPSLYYWDGQCWIHLWSRQPISHVSHWMPTDFPANNFNDRTPPTSGAPLDALALATEVAHA